MEETKKILKIEQLIKKNKLAESKAINKIKKNTTNKRMSRTRTLIQLGGLLKKTGLLDKFNIELGEDLQLNNESRNKSYLLLGFLLENTSHSLNKELPEHTKISLRKIGLKCLSN